MRIGLFVLCLVSAALTALAMVPGMIVLGLALVVLPGLILAAAPWICALSTASLVAVILFGRLGGAARVRAYAGFALALAGAATAAAWWLNRPVMAHWQALAAADRPGPVSRDGVHAIAVLQEREVTGRNPLLCTARCQRLLYSGTVDAVLQGPAAPGAGALDPAQPVVRYRIERRDACPPFALPEGLAPRINAEAFARNGLLDDTRKRIAAGDCLLAEAATVAQSDLAVVDDVLAIGHEPYLKDRWSLSLDTLAARRLTIYRLREGQPVLLSRQTALTAYPLFVPLLISLRTGGVMDIEYGLLRVRRDQPGDDIDVFFAKVFGLDAPPAPPRAGAVPGTVVSLPAPPPAAGPVQAPADPMASVASRLGAALADPALPPDAPGLLLANRYLEEVAHRGSADLALMRALITDRRETDFNDALRRAVEALGAASAPLALPLLDRIEAELPGQPKVLRPLLNSFEALPPGAALAVMPRLEALAQDPLRREALYPILPRLADKGPDSLRYFRAWIEAAPARRPMGDSDRGNNRGDRPPGGALLRAGIAGLCRLGPAAASAAPLLFAQLQPLQDAAHMTAVELAQIEALARMGQEPALATYFTRPPVARFVQERLRSLPEPACRIR